MRPSYPRPEEIGDGKNACGTEKETYSATSCAAPGKWFRFTIDVWLPCSGVGREHL